MKQITIRGIEPELHRKLCKLAREQGVSLAAAAKSLLRRAAGLEEPVSGHGGDIATDSRFARRGWARAAQRARERWAAENPP